MDSTPRSTSNPEVKEGKLPHLDTIARKTNSRYLQKPWGFSISRSKKQQELTWLKNKEIQLENKALMNKMKQINTRRSRSIKIQTNDASPPKMLHQQFRKEQSRIVRQQNQFKRKRVVSQKASIDLKQLQKDWQNKLNIKSFLEKHRRSSELSSKSIDLTQVDWIHSEISNRVKYNKQRDIGGVKLRVKVEEYCHVYFIEGRVKETGLIMIIVLQKEKVDSLIKNQCKGKVQNLGNLLHFDPQINTLYYLTQDKQMQENMISQTCSEFDFKTLKKVIEKQHKMLISKKKGCKFSQGNSIMEASEEDEKSVKPNSNKKSTKLM